MIWRENYINVVSETASELRFHCESNVSHSVRELNTRISKIQAEFEEKVSSLEKCTEYEMESDSCVKMAPGIHVVREAPNLGVFTGKNCDGETVKRWLRKAEECVSALGLKGVAAVRYIKSSLEDPALTRIRLAKPGDMNELREVLLDAYGEKLSVTELKYKLWSRKQANWEDVWEYADAITELDEELQMREERSSGERENVKCVVFAKGLKDEEMSVKVRKKIDKGDIKDLDEAVKCVREKHKERSVNIARERSRVEVRCWRCGELGHVANRCKETWKGYSLEDRDRNMGEGYPQGKVLHDGYKYSGNQIVMNELGRYSIKGACWNCRQIGHPMSQCPFGYKGDEGEKRYHKHGIENEVVRRVNNEYNYDEQGNANCRTLEKTSGMN